VVVVVTWSVIEGFRLKAVMCCSLICATAKP